MLHLHRLIIMRHGEAESAAGRADHARRLTPDGKADAMAVGKQIIARSWQPDLVISSDSKRTQETAEALVQSGAMRATQIRWAPELYLSGLAALSREIGDLDNMTKTLLVLGHNPGWSEAAEQLTGEAVSLATADAALLCAEAESWKHALQSQGVWNLQEVLRG